MNLAAELGRVVINETDWKQALFRRVKDHARSLVIGDLFAAGQLEDVVAWSGGEIAWRQGDLAVVRALY